MTLHGESIVPKGGDSTSTPSIVIVSSVNRDICIKPISTPFPTTPALSLRSHTRPWSLQSHPFSATPCGEIACAIVACVFKEGRLPALMPATQSRCTECPKSGRRMTVSPLVNLIDRARPHPLPLKRRNTMNMTKMPRTRLNPGYPPMLSPPPHTIPPQSNRIDSSHPDLGQVRLKYIYCCLDGRHFIQRLSSQSGNE